MEKINKKLLELKSLSGPLPIFPTDDVLASPHELFVEWLSLAIDQGIREPHAMTLSTIDASGSPDSRVLILKRMDHNGWYFATSSIGKKGRQIESSSKVALCFYWPALGRQVRIRGNAVKMDKESSAKDFLARNAIARAIALIERQSYVLKNNHELDKALLTQYKKVKRTPKVISDSWTLYCVKAEEVEFWQGANDRKHTRLLYRMDGNEWVRELLWP